MTIEEIISKHRVIYKFDHAFVIAAGDFRYAWDHRIMYVVRKDNRTVIRLKGIGHGFKNYKRKAVNGKMYDAMIAIVIQHQLCSTSV